MLSATRYAVRAPAVVHEVIDGEAVIINLESGAYFSADGASAVAWQGIAGGASPADLAAMIAERYEGDGATIAAAVEGFVETLLHAGLIRPAELGDANSPAELPAAAARPAFAGLALRGFTDLQELLLLDPIHEVDETGWPAPLARR
jgi:hypothetical protein